MIKKLRQRLKQKKLAKTRHRALNDWESLYKNLQSHPLTQAKLINEELLATTNETFKEIKNKISDIDSRVGDIENKVFDKNFISKEIQEKVIVPFAKLSESEKQIIGHIKDRENCDASAVAEVMGMSRSNASLKLNKLYSWNFLDKSMDDKRVVYRLKTEDKVD